MPAVTASGPGTACGTLFCTTALFTRGLDAAGVSRMAGHANVRITLDMYANSQELHQMGEKLQVA